MAINWPGVERAIEADLLTCNECRGERYIVDGFLVCAKGCGKLIGLRPEVRELAKKYPERIIVTRSAAKMAAMLNGEV